MLHRDVIGIFFPHSLLTACKTGAPCTPLVVQGLAKISLCCIQLFLSLACSCGAPSQLAEPSLACSAKLLNAAPELRFPEGPFFPGVVSIVYRQGMQDSQCPSRLDSKTGAPPQ